MEHHPYPDLTRNQSLVMGALSQATTPLGAYTILARLREYGFRAPLQVYRALDKLMDFGMVHRLESLNAFVACGQPESEDHQAAAFTICEDCGEVAEISDDSLARQLDHLASEAGFQLNEPTVELRGVCQGCSSG